MSKERVSRVIYNVLDMRKFLLNGYPNADQKRERVTASKAILDQFKANFKYFLSLIVTMDETWLHHYVLKPKKSQKSGDIEVNRVLRSSGLKSQRKSYGLCILG